LITPARTGQGTEILRSRYSRASPHYVLPRYWYSAFRKPRRLPRNKPCSAERKTNPWINRLDKAIHLRGFWRTIAERTATRPRLCSRKRAAAQVTLEFHRCWRHRYPIVAANVTYLQSGGLKGDDRPGTQHRAFRPGPLARLFRIIDSTNPEHTVKFRWLVPRQINRGETEGGKLRPESGRDGIESGPSRIPRRPIHDRQRAGDGGP